MRGFFVGTFISNSLGSKSITQKKRKKKDLTSLLKVPDTVPRISTFSRGQETDNSFFFFAR